MAQMTAKQRKNLPDSAFVFPKERRYPIHDKAHAKTALYMVKTNGTISEQKRVIAAVRARYGGTINVQAKPGQTPGNNPFKKKRG